MKDFRTRILSADYGKRFRLLIAAGLCIFLIGGGTSLVLLHTVDAGTLGRQPQGQMQQGNMPGKGGAGGRAFGHGHGMHHGGSLSMLLHNSQLSIATRIAVLATTVLGILWLILAWYTIVCYLYRSSTFSRMNRVLWTVLGVFGSVFALIAFFIARSILKAQCGNCKNWQDADQEYCSDCGNALRKQCSSCGASVPQSAAFCHSCGKKLSLDTPVEENTEATTL